MTLGYSHNTSNLIDLLGPKPLTLLIVLLLAIGAFVFTPGEALAEQKHTGSLQYELAPANDISLASFAQPSSVDALGIERGIPKARSSAAWGPATLSNQQSPGLEEPSDSRTISLAFEHDARLALKQRTTLGEKNELLMSLTQRKLPTPLPKKFYFGDEARGQEPTQISERSYRVATA